MISFFLFLNTATVFHKIYQEYLHSFCIHICCPYIWLPYTLRCLETFYIYNLEVHIYIISTNNWFTKTIQHYLETFLSYQILENIVPDKDYIT